MAQDPVPTDRTTGDPAAVPDTRVAEQVAVDVSIRLGAIALGVFVVFLLVRPFAGLLLWSCILAVSLFPVFAWLRARLGGRDKLAAALLTVLALLTVFGPVAVLLSSLVVSLETFAVSLRTNGVHIPDLPPHVAAFEVFGRTLGSVWAQLAAQVHGYVATHAHTLLGTGAHALRAVAALAGSILVFAGAVLVAGLLYGPGPRVLALMNRGLHKIRLKTWDRFIVPLPFSRGVLAVGDGFTPDRRMTDAEMAAACDRLSAMITDLTDRCEAALRKR
jgi:predicted PurR-regulated permease PerM